MNKPLFELTAADLMSWSVLIISRAMSLRGAAQLLFDAKVSGAPLVNDDGCCVGVISATDFVRCASKQLQRVGSSVEPTQYWSDWVSLATA